MALGSYARYNRPYWASDVGDITWGNKVIGPIYGPRNYIKDYYLNKAFHHIYGIRHTVPWKAGNLATTIAQGNYMTRNYRQKPLAGLEVWQHARPPAQLKRKIYEKIKPKKGPIPSLAVLYEEQGNRRVKNPKNILLTTTNRMPYSKRSYTRAPKRRYKSKKGATNRKNTKKVPKKVKSVTKVLQKQVKQLQKAVNVDKATHTFKQCNASSIKSLIGRCNHTAFGGSSVAELETACTYLRYYDPAVPGTLVTANANTGSFARDVAFKNYYTKLTMRNNYQVPARVKVYLCKVKNDCNETPLTTYTTAIADQVITAGVDETDQLIHLTEIERVKEVWNVDCVIDKVLEPGQEAVTTHSTGPFNFDPSHVDSFTNAYQQVYKGFAYVMRIEGVLAHDTAAAEYSLAAAGIDYELTRKAIIEYDAGVDLDDIYIVEGRVQAFTNGGVSSLKPIADNIAYSVA